ncbi:MAG: PEP/pyruvate-binding domain-containing protein [Thermoplasmatota archaeon]
MADILGLTEIREKNLELVGGKAANLAELVQTGHRVPPGFVITATAFRKFLETSGVQDKLVALLKGVQVDETKALHDAADQLRKMILAAPMAPDLRNGIIQAYRKLASVEGGGFVAVRSSATAEDLPEASFAGQQDTYLNIKGEDAVVEHVQRCWASLYTPRALFYRAKHSFEHSKVAIAVVVMAMVDAEKAGVMFTKHPTTGKNEIIVEAAWGLGEGVVSGNVSPDHYLLNPDGSLGAPPRIAVKGSMYIRGKEGKTEVRSVPADKSGARVLSDAELKELAGLARAVESHYGTPQDIEWAIGGDAKLYLLQARPITTIKKAPLAASAPPAKSKAPGSDGSSGTALVTGLGAAPGIATGKVAIIASADELDRCGEGDVLVTTMTSPDMVPAMRRAAAIVTDEGGVTCFPAETLVLTDQGLVPIGNLDALLKEREVLVLSMDPVSFKTEWKPIVAWRRRHANVVEVAVSQTGNGSWNQLRATPNHKFLIMEGAGLMEKPLADVLAHEEMVTTVDRVPAIHNRTEDAWPVPPHLAGGIFTDGNWYANHRRDGVRLIQKETPEKAAFIQYVRESYESAFGSSMRRYTLEGTATIRGHTFATSALHLYDQKRAPAEAFQETWDALPQLVLSSTPESLRQFLAGVADGDGTFHDGGTRLQIYCGDEHLTHAVVLAFLRLGIQPTLAKNKTIANIQVTEGIDEILAHTKRLKGRAGPKALGTKLFPAKQLFRNPEEIVALNPDGQFGAYVGGNLLIDGEKLRPRLHALKAGARRDYERLLDAPLRANRVRPTGAASVEDIVYNIEVADHHNYVVFTSGLTPVLVGNCHAAIVSRELGVPCVVGTKTATKTLPEGTLVTVDGDKGNVVEGAKAPVKAALSVAGLPAELTTPPIFTATQVKVNISMAEAIDRAIAVRPDGVGLLRIEHMILGLGKHPLAYIRGGKEAEYVTHLADELRKIVEPMHPRPVWIRTLDAPTDEFRAMEGGQDEPHEHNPMLGWRGIRRGLRQPEMLRAELKAVKKLVDQGFTNLGVMLPLVQHPAEIREAKEVMREVGLEPHRDVAFGIMVEIPAAAIIIDQLIAEGLDFVSFGTNDLTQYTLAVDRNNENVANLYNEFHPAIGRLIEETIRIAKAHGVETSICGQAGSNPKFVEKLIRWGISSVSANIDAVARVRETVARTEQRLLLDAARMQEMQGHGHAHGHGHEHD